MSKPKRNRKQRPARRSRDRPDASFYTPEWQAKEREADEAIARGEVSGPYATTKEAIDALHKAAGRTRK